MDLRIKNKGEENGDTSKSSFLTKCIMKTITHPLDYARFLVQAPISELGQEIGRWYFFLIGEHSESSDQICIGHEPMAPYRYKPPFYGEERLYLPNLFIYAKYIYSVDGFKGMYIGLAPKILGICIEHFSALAVSDYIQFDKNENANNKDSDLEVWKKCAIMTSKELLCTATSIILSHPLQVVSMRMMAQFIGYEHRYTVVLPSLLLISREEGVNGLYAGIIPRLLTGLGTVILVNVAKQAFSRYLFDPSPITLNIADFTASYLANLVTYPFNVVTACTAISNCGLAAGMPPEMPVFGNWLDCMRHLYRIEQLNRGSSTWNRRLYIQSQFLK